MKEAQEAEFVALAGAHAARLRRTAYGLSGDWHSADDLVQRTWLKLFTAWPLREPAAVEGWLLLTLVRHWIDDTRRPRWRREQLTGSLPERADPAGDAPPGRTLDADLLGHLARLSAGQRATLVLRFLDDCSVERTAEILRCSTGTVKSQTSRGLAALRGLMTDASDAPLSPPTISRRTRP